MATCNHQAHLFVAWCLFLWFASEKRVVIHDTECLYCDQVSLNNTKFCQQERNTHDDFHLVSTIFCSGDNQSVRLSVLVVSRVVMTWKYVASILVTWLIVFFLRRVPMWAARSTTRPLWYGDCRHRHQHLYLVMMDITCNPDSRYGTIKSKTHMWWWPLYLLVPCLHYTIAEEHCYCNAIQKVSEYFITSKHSLHQKLA